MDITVFIQNEPGTIRKNYHDEKTLQFKFYKTVSSAYPYPYGFILNTDASDGSNVDCYVITRQPLRSAQIVQCHAIGLMEQFEDGLDDHNVLATLLDEEVQITPEIESKLTDFVLGVFRHVEAKQIQVGRFLGPEDAIAYITSHLESEGK